MGIIRSYLNNVISDSISGTEKVLNKHLLNLLFILIFFYYIYFSLVLFPNFSTQAEIQLFLSDKSWLSKGQWPVWRLQCTFFPCLSSALSSPLTTKYRGRDKKARNRYSNQGQNHGRPPFSFWIYPLLTCAFLLSLFSEWYLLTGHYQPHRSYL